MDEVLSALNIPIQIGDFIATARSTNGFQEVSKGIVTKIDAENLKISVLGLSGERYLYGKSNGFDSGNHKIRKFSMYARLAIQVPLQLSTLDKDFNILINSKEYALIN